MHKYSDEEILEMFPGINGYPVAEIVPVTYIRRNRIADSTPEEEVCAVRGIGVSHRRSRGFNPATGEEMFENIQYEIGPFDLPGTTYRTDKIPRLSKEVDATVIIRYLLEHDGHMDEAGNVKNFYLDPVDLELQKIEKEALKNRELRRGREDGRQRGGFPHPRIDDTVRQGGRDRVERTKADAAAAKSKPKPAARGAKAPSLHGAPPIPDVEDDIDNAD